MSEYRFLLRSGKHVLVDAVDRDLEIYSWHQRSGNGPVEYVYYEGGGKLGKQFHIALRRLIMERILGRPLTPKEKVSHRNRDTLDCRRDNLQIGMAFYQRSVHKRSTSGYRGVRKNGRRWVSVFIDKETREMQVLGTFATPEEAAFAYNEEMKKRGEPEQFLNVFSEEAQEKLDEILRKREQGIPEIVIGRTGKVVLLSPEDSDLTQYVWHLHSNMGIARRDREKEGRPYVFLKKVIAERIFGRKLARNEGVFFHDEDIYNHRRENIYYSTTWERHPWKNSTPKPEKEEKEQRRKTRRVYPQEEPISPFLEQCVVFDGYIQKWIAVLPVRGEYQFLGTFATKEEALNVCRKEFRRA